MDNTNVNYFLRIPDELKLKIFSFLNTFEIISLTQVWKDFSNVAQDRSLFRIIMLYRENRFKTKHLRSILSNKLYKDCITSLNVNCVYWIEKVDLKKCLNLPMLKHFYAIATKLRLIDFNFAQLSKLDSLAIGIVKFFGFSMASLNNLKRLHIHYDLDHCDLSVVKELMEACCSLEEFWFIDLTHHCCLNSNFENVVVPSLPRTLKKCVMSICGTFIFFPINIDGSSADIRKTRTKIQGLNFNCCVSVASRCRRRICNIYNSNYFENNVWNDIVKLTLDAPFGYKDVQSLIHKEKTLDTIMWEELSLSHKYIKCCYKDVLPLELVLFTSNTINLRKLSINNCLARLGDCAHVKEEQKILFKRRRIAYKTKSKLGEKTLLEKIVSHSSRIDELEIWECEEVMQNKFRLSQDALLSIKNLQHLEKLTLSNLPSYIKGGFLVDIFKNCVNLKSLRISYYETNTTLTNSLCCAMPFAGSLKDLRVHEDTMKVSSILDALCKMPLGSLERLVLSCRTCDNFDTCAILKFLDSNRHLQFLCFVINSSTETFFKHIRSTLKQLQGPDRIFVVLRNMELVPRSFFIPSVHKIEMMQCNSYVSGIDIFNGLANYN